MSDFGEQFESLIDSPDAHNWDVLHPDLVPYVVVKPRIGKMIHHPLIVEISPIIPLANRTYLARKAEFDKALARGDVKGMLRHVQRPYRISSLLEWNAAGIIDSGAVLHWMPWAWSDAEPDDTDPAYLDMWMRLAAVPRLTGEQLGDELPADAGDPVTVYRGQHTAHEKRGIAWSLDPRIARAFALRFNLKHEFGAVLRGVVKRENVLCYIHESGRGENEVIAAPRRVKITGVALVPIIGDTDMDSIVYAELRR